MKSVVKNIGDKKSVSKRTMRVGAKNPREKKPPKECAAGKVRNPKTGRCILAQKKPRAKRSCKYGPRTSTGKCPTKKRSPQQSPKKPSPPPKSPESSDWGDYPEDKGDNKMYAQFGQFQKMRFRPSYKGKYASYAPSS